MPKSANVVIHQGKIKLYSGNVNINNRIYTNDTLKDFGNGIYEITPRDTNDLGVVFGFFSSPPARPLLANATIDGRNYTGKQILVEGSEVSIDGERVTLSTEASLSDIR